MKITSNKIIINKLERSKISEDFSIIKIFSSYNNQTNQQKRKFYDLFKKSFEETDLNAYSVMFGNDEDAFVLFKKDKVDEDGIEKYINNQKNLELKKNKIDIHSELEISDEKLLQLLANALPNDRSFEENTFNNISGKLLVQNSSSYGKGKVTMYVISFDLLDKITKDIALNIEGITFYTIEKCKKNPQYTEKISEKATYVVDENTMKFRKFLKEDYGNYKESEKYIDMRPFKYQKNSSISKFVSVENYEKFHNSKCGMLYTFMDEFNSINQKYLQIELDSKLSEYEELDKKLAFSTIEKLYPKLNELGINVEDTIGTINSELVLNFFIKSCKELGVNNISFNNENAQLKLKMIHSPEFYKKEDVIDQHEKSTSTQHLCIESFEKEKRLNGGEFEKIITDLDGNVVKKVLFEFGIKNDIKNKKIDMFSFKDFESEIKYVIQQYDRLVKKIFYYEIVVQKNGDFQYSKIGPNEIEKYKEYRGIFFRCTKNFKSKKKVEIIIFYKEYTFFLIDTGEKVIPNDLNKIEFRLKNNCPTRIIEKDNLLGYLEEFKKIYKDKYNSEIEELVKKVKNYGPYYIEYQNIMNSQTHRNKNYRKPMVHSRGEFAKNLNEFLIDNGIVLNPAVRSSTNGLMTPLTNFHVLKKNSNEYYYYVASKKNLKKEYANANHIRKIIVEEKTGKQLSEQVIDQLLKQFTVDFVKNEEYTVTPFINKYIRDCMELFSK